MEEAEIIQAGIGLLEGFTFKPNLSRELINILFPPRQTENEDAAMEDTTAESVRDAVGNCIADLFDICVRHHDVYLRCEGGETFCYLVLAVWKPEVRGAPFSPANIGRLIALSVEARRIHTSQSSTSRIIAATKLINNIDATIKIIDKISANKARGSRRRGNSVSSLYRPRYEKQEQTRPWPPLHFGPLDVAMVGMLDTRTEFFGLDWESKPKKEKEPLPTYPGDQDLPDVIRKYLCWLSLRETKPDSKVGLFLAPIAFHDHQGRKEWYWHTDKQSRLYATTDEFLDYAEEQLTKESKFFKNTVLGLLTPWFFDVEEVVTNAEKRQDSVPKVWQKTCFRAGMMISLARFNSRDNRYQLILFKPTLPHYERAAEPPDRQKKQDAWLEELIGKIRARFQIEEAWVGRKAKHHIKAPKKRKVAADSVESSCEFITEVVEEPRTIPNTKKDFLDRAFEVLEWPVDVHATNVMVIDG
ncbi:hypothetical protein F5Y04DRAFT_276285 [Hypomontagnella monticulosa]|nr:hypothetical protein F5Y04DRAFT_276285 [Hypomontagnella monticulosa]